MNYLCLSQLAKNYIAKEINAQYFGLGFKFDMNAQ